MGCYYEELSHWPWTTLFFPLYPSRTLTGVYTWVIRNLSELTVGLQNNCNFRLLHSYPQNYNRWFSHWYAPHMHTRQHPCWFPFTRISIQKKGNVCGTFAEGNQGVASHENPLYFNKSCKWIAKPSSAILITHVFAGRVTLDYDHCQVNWFMHFLLWTTDWNNHSTKPMTYHNSEQVYEPRLHSVSNGYKHTLCQQYPSYSSNNKRSTEPCLVGGALADGATSGTKKTIQSDCITLSWTDFNVCLLPKHLPVWRTGWTVLQIVHTNPTEYFTVYSTEQTGP